LGSAGVLVRIRCKCGNEVSFRTRNSYTNEIVVCSRCGAMYRLRIEFSVAEFPIQNLEKELEEFKVWLYSNRGITSAGEYVKMLKRYLDNPKKFPKTLAPLNHFVDYIREKYGEEIAYRVKKFLF